MQCCLGLVTNAQSLCAAIFPWLDRPVLFSAPSLARSVGTVPCCAQMALRSLFETDRSAALMRGRKYTNEFQKP